MKGGGLATTVAAALIAFAFGMNWSVSHDLDWPCEIDFYRDMGGAQAILDGRFGEDPGYREQANWFNPLQPAVVAGIATATNQTIHHVYASWGPILNLLGPIGFFILARLLIGAWPAVAALAAYLYLGDPRIPSWFQATYSAWAWPMNFAQGFFYLTAACVFQAVRTRRLGWETIAGVMLGITFLAHTAPTLVLVGMLFIITFIRLPGEGWRACRLLCITGIVSLMVSTPFLLPIWSKYHMHVVNDAPSRYAPIGAAFVLQQLLTPRAAIGLIGLIIWVYDAWVARGIAEDGRASARRLVFSGLLLSATLLFGYGLTAQFLEQNGLPYPPRVLPTYHFHLYLKAFESILFGVGLAGLTHYVLTSARRPRASLMQFRSSPELLAPLLLLLIWAMPKAKENLDRTWFRNLAMQKQSETDRIQMYEWILSRSQPDDVFMADPITGVTTVAAAGRKTVCLDEQYSNIYVDFRDRFHDLADMYHALTDEDLPHFCETAREYGVQYVIVDQQAELTDCRVERVHFEHLHLPVVFESGRYMIYRVDEPLLEQSKR